MYLDTILFIIGSIFTAAMLILAVYLLISRKRSRAYNDITEKETELFNTASLSLFKTHSTQAQSKQYLYPSAVNAPYADGTELIGPPEETDGFDPYSLMNFYTIEREIGGGAMSRTFEVKSVKLKNRWFMKYIPKKYGKLANEVEILKQLNHASLPRIIDVFHREEGDYLVETLVEGFPLKEFNRTGVKVNQTMLQDWFVQIAQALSYLHNMKPSPIYHLDLKPGNIMVTHNNRLVLVDFGISRSHGDDTVAAVTVNYAAPEQFSGHSISSNADIIYERFGDISGITGQAFIDARTDIFSLGVIMFEQATGLIPKRGNMDVLKKHVSAELSGIIYKCLAINPTERYQTADELISDLNNVKGTKFHMARLMATRKIAAVMASLSLLISGGTFTGGFIVYNEENAAIVFMQPDIITVSLQQTGDFTVKKQMPDGTDVYIGNNQIVWYEYDDNIARIEGNRVSGINEGETIIRGQHRNKDIELMVRVVRPVDGLTDVSQQYEAGRSVSLFAGTGDRTRRDGSLTVANFMSPESITVTGNGTVYITDAGEVRMISGGSVSTLEIPVDYIKASIVRSFENELYFLTQPWQDENRYYYALVRFSGGDVEALYIADAQYTAIEDFTFGENGLLYFIDRNEGMREIYLKSLNIYNVEDIKTLAVLPAGSSSLAIDNNDYAYIGNKDRGVIHVYRDGKLEYFSGIEGERAFIDGASPRFYSPQRLEYNNGFLYVWDFNTLRRIETENGVAGMCITVAGMASPEFEQELSKSRIAAEDAILPFGSLMDFAVFDETILLTDYKRGVIWEIWS